MEADAVEIRVLGCLLEKQRTTPDTYPLSLNALRLACNQATNRDPVVSYDEATVVEALRRTALRGWTRLASGAGSRARKYRHLLVEALALDDAELSLLAVLMLRGPQTPGELKQRADRLHGFADLAEVHGALERLIEHGHAARLERRPGQKEERYEQLLGGREDGAAAGEAPIDAETSAAAIPDPAPTSPGAGDRLDRLERDLAGLRRQVEALREALGEPGEPQA
ncbi:MAG TPA: YceH family protein [Solirubrobacterales bacterium]|nr:YceH family protein [Solirubrobacterales bacterium]